MEHKVSIELKSGVCCQYWGGGIKIGVLAVSGIVYSVLEQFFSGEAL